MRLSEFHRAVADEFGEAYGASIVRDLVIHSLGDRTAAQALREGEPAREVWQAMCAAMDVPKERWYGVGRIDPPR